MITRPLPYSPYPRSSGEMASGGGSAGPGLIPYVTLREGEEVAPATLAFVQEWPGNRLRLRYTDEEPEDRDVRGVLWGRCSQNRRDQRNMLTGKPLWRLMHPSRQRECMQAMRCQVCVQPAKTPLGYIFLAGPVDYRPNESTIVTAQPPVCARHVRAAAMLCPHLSGRPLVFLAESAPLYGVHGTVYGYGQGGVHAVDQPDFPLRYGDPDLPVFLASQLVRRLSVFRRLSLAELLAELTAFRAPVPHQTGSVHACPVA
ncbi:hypothetical protein ACWDA7_37230 [Streptomyces sp. NPDC001156]